MIRAKLHRSACAAALLGLAACASGPERRYPLIPGGSQISTVTCVRTVRSQGPNLPFAVDASALPSEVDEPEEYTKDAFCRDVGRWAAVPLPGGTLVACDVGEFGGFVQFHDGDGHLSQVLLVDSVFALVCDGESLAVVGGLMHLTSVDGHVTGFRRDGDGWVQVGRCQLPGKPLRVSVLANGALRIEIINFDLLSPTGDASALPVEVRALELFSSR